VKIKRKKRLLVISVTSDIDERSVRNFIGQTPTKTYICISERILIVKSHNQTSYRNFFIEI
jgi:hypothetical protein